jgi:hypothetical protein
MRLYLNSKYVVLNFIFCIGFIQVMMGQMNFDIWQKYQQDTLLQIQCNHYIQSGSFYPRVSAVATEHGYSLSLQGERVQAVVWFYSQGELTNKYKPDELVAIPDTLDFYYAVVLDSVGCVYTTDPIKPGIQSNTLACEDTCSVTTSLFTETFTQAEHCSSAFNFPQASDHTFSGLNVNGPACTVHPMIQQLNPLLPEGLFYLEDNAVNINPFWNRTDASIPPDAFLIGDPWDYPEYRIWYHDFSLVAGETYCFSVKVSNVQNNQSSGYLPVADLRFSDASGFQWPASFQLFGQPLTLMHSDGWRTLSGSFQAAVTGVHRIAIVNNATVSTNTNGTGRNLAIDDISFVRVETAAPVLSASQSLVCAGDTVTLYATSSLPGFTCAWSTMPATTTTQACTFTTAPLVNTLFYMGSGDQGCNSSVYVAVKPKAKVELPLLHEVCFGDSAHIPFTFTGIAPWVFQYTDGISTNTITALTSPFYYSFLPSVATMISVLNISSDGCLQTVPTSVVVNPRPLPFAHMVGNSPLTLGQPDSLQIILSGTPPWEFTWTDGTAQYITSGVTQSPYVLFVTPTVNTLYSLVSVYDFCPGNVHGSILAGELETVSEDNDIPDAHFQIIPNPVIGNVFYLSAAHQDVGLYDVFIFDVQGKQIQFDIIHNTGDLLQFSLPSEAPSGVYFLHIQGQGSIYRFKCLVHNQ